MIKIKIHSKDPDKETEYIKLTESNAVMLSNMLWEFYYGKPEYYG